MSNKAAKRRARRAERIQANDPRHIRAATGELGFRGRATFGVIEAKDSTPKTRTFEIVAYTGGELEQGWWDAPVIVDLAGVDVSDGRLPILDGHIANPEMVVGQSESATVENNQLVLRGRMIEVNDAAKKIINLADSGLSWQASIGARCLQKDFIAEGNSVSVNGRSFDGPVYVSRKTLIREVSFVVIGADLDTSVLVASGGTMSKIAAKMTFAEYCKTHGFEADKLSKSQETYLRNKFSAEMDEETDDDEDEEADKKTGGKNKDASASATLDLKAQADFDLKAARAAQVAENTRVREIKAMCAANPDLRGEITVNGKTEAVVILDHAISAGWTAEQTAPHFKLAEIKAQNLAGVREDRPASAPFGYVPSEPISQGLKADPNFHQKVLEAAVLQAGNCQLESDAYYFQRGRDGNPERRVPENIQANAQRDWKARYTDQVQQAAHTAFGKGIGLWQVLASAARSGGYRGSDIVNDGNLGEILRCAFSPIIRADGSSTISIQNLLANVMNKFLLAGYLNADQSWRYICAVRPVKDFKPTKSINLTGDFVFKKLNADGQIVNAAMTDEAFANQIDTLARKLGIGRQTIINDDLSGLTTVPLLMGLGGADGLNILIWTLWNSPGNAPDGNAFWYASRSTAANALGGLAANANALAAGGSSALSSTSLQSAVAVMDKQVKPNGQPLGVPPEILLYPPELDQTAIELMNSAFVVGPTSSKQPNTNTFYKRFTPVKSPYLSNSTYTGYSTTAWWLLASPQRLPAIEVAFLNGQETPTVQTAQANFNELGIDIRGFFDPGVAMQNFRAGCRSPGA
jgi:Mu-like prophage major head subunit gpT